MRTMTKKKVILLWVLFAVCLVVTVVLNRCMAQSNVEYEEVKATVLSTRTVKVTNRRTANTTTMYEVEVQYQGETYQLENVHGLSGYQKGATVKAYLAGDRLFANVEGVKTSTPLAMVYFGFLFGSFILLFAAAVSMGKLPKKPKGEPPQLQE